MSNKKILVKESGFINFVKSFFRAKSQGTESDWLKRLRKQDPKLADIWGDFDDAVANSVATKYRVLKSSGIDTDHLDKFVNKYGIKKGKSLY